MSGFLLDTCALIALLNDEPGADVVEKVLEQGPVFMTAINLLEVCYDALRRSGKESNVALILRHIEAEGVVITWSLSQDDLLAAARWKARGRLSLADAVALGVAQTRELQLVTADHHEFDPLEPLGWLAFKWIR